MKYYKMFDATYCNTVLDLDNLILEINNAGGKDCLNDDGLLYFGVNYKLYSKKEPYYCLRGSKFKRYRNALLIPIPEVEWNTLEIINWPSDDNNIIATP